MHGARKSTNRPARPRVRAGKACKRCNQKRIKCDALRHMPCTNCVQNGNAECVLRESKRGTYIRKAHGQDAAESPELAAASGEAGISTTEPPHVAEENAAPASVQDPVSGVAPHQEAGTDQTIDANLPAGAHRSSVDAEPPQIAGAPLPQSPECARSFISHGSAPFTGSPFQPSSAGQENTPSHYRDISWSTMFDHFVNSRKDGKEFVDKCSITYLGESFPLSIVLGDLNEGGCPKLHHPGPPFPGSEQLTDRSSQSHSTHILPEDLEFLRTNGIFDYPDKLQLATFLEVFLERVYPLYPIVNRHELLQQHAAGELPLILLYSICFIAATFCPLVVVHRAGFVSRRAARFSYYKKVKALFDSGYEINKIVILQSAILMSFWGGGPNNYWNFYSWISTAVTIAEGLGIHRSTATTNMQSRDKSLLRRLWWILVTRDSACSSLVGRPFRIDLDNSDTEMLTVEDFTHDAMASDFLETPSRQSYAQYQIEISKLGLILRDIIMSRFYPKRRPFTPEMLQERLDQWREELPPTLVWQDDMPDYCNPFSMTLSVQYNHHLILLHLGRVRNVDMLNDNDHDNDTMGNAAQQISAVACTAVTKSNTLTLPHELFHGVFMAQAVFYTKLKSPNKLLAQVGRSALTNCQMVFHEACDCWDPSPWIMQLFDSLSSRRSERQPVNATNGSQPVGTAEIFDLGAVSGSTPEAGVFSGLLGYDPWQSNPMLSSLFDLPPELLLPE